MQKRDHVLLRLAVAAVCVSLLWSSIGLSDKVRGAVVWSENFDDGNSNGWNCVGTFAVQSGALQATGPNWNYAVHPSSVAYGTWSFDVNAVDTPDNHFYIYLLASSASNYRISVWTGTYPGWVDEPKYSLLKTHAGITTEIGDYVPGGAILGWQTLTVTRSATGHFEVRVNSVLGFEATDNTITTAGSFQFVSQSGPSIDNIVVNDTDGADTVPTTATPGVPGFAPAAIALGLLLAAGVATKHRSAGTSSRAAR